MGINHATTRSFVTSRGQGSDEVITVSECVFASVNLETSSDSGLRQQSVKLWNVATHQEPATFQRIFRLLPQIGILSWLIGLLFSGVNDPGAANDLNL